MGYNTRYFLTVKPPNPETIPALKVFSGEADYCLNDDGTTNNGGRWYEHEKDMREFSKHRLDVLFTLEGEGEEVGDMWKKYFKNGLCQVARAHITIDKFDPKKLI